MDGTRSENSRSTVVGDLEAMWRLDGHSARIMLVHDTSGEILVSYEGPDYPDLASARDRSPDLSPLWDAVRHDLWTAITPPCRTSNDRRWWG